MKKENSCGNGSMLRPPASLPCKPQLPFAEQWNDMITINRNNILLNGDELTGTTIKNQSLQVVKTDENGHFIYLDRLFCDLAGIREADFIGRHYLELVLPEDHEKCARTFNACLAALGQMQRLLLRKHAPGGIVSTEWQFICLDSQLVNEVLCLGHDVTPFVRMQENLENLVNLTSRQNEWLRDFTYIISHYIRSHVANLSGIMNGIDKDDPDD